MMDYENGLSKGIIYTWKIKNISCFQGTEFCSPELKGFQDTQWQLKLYLKEKHPDPRRVRSDVTCTIFSIKDEDLLERNVVLSDMTFNSENCTWIGLRVKLHPFRVGSGGKMRRSEISLGSSLVHNLTIRCRLRTRDTCPSLFSHCNAVTEFDAHYSVLESSIKQSVNGNLFLTQSRSQEESGNSSIDIRSSLSETQLIFEVTLNNDVIPDTCVGHIYLKQDRKGSLLWLKEAVKPAAYKKGQLWTIPLTFCWNDFVSKKKYHFLNDEITIQFELVSSFGQMICSTSTLTLDGSEDHDITMRRGKILNFSLLAMLQNDILCDVQLKTATRTFPAHKVVLCVNSTVFCAMFSSDMKEKASNIVEISDIEEHVIERLVHYVYSGDVGDLTWDLALELYYAANKYQMNLLKNECSAFLSANLSLANICEALVLSNKHNDSYLQLSVHNFIARHTADVLNSKGWKDFANKEAMWALNVLCQTFKP